MKFTDALASAVSGKPPINYTPRNTSTVFTSGYGGARLALIAAMGANGTLFATVNRTSNATSQVEWKLWRKSRSGKDEDRQEVTKHLALDVWGMPNAFAPRQLFVESFQQHVDLVGEGWWVIAHNVFGWPESIWCVRPDRIEPVPSASLGVAGYVYTSPDGEKVPLTPREVIRLRMPNPADPGPAGRGMGAVQTILAQIEGVQMSAQWNRNFFANSAVPGGIITVPETLGDVAFKRLQMQWKEQHQGVSNAARVGVLEGGAKFEPGAVQKDMQFVELQTVSRAVIREAFGMPKFMLGEVDDVNRATAEAADAMFGTWLLVPRLERIKSVLNTQFLPQFLPDGAPVDVEFDYESPVPPNAEAENTELTAKVNAYVALTAAGVSPADASKTVDLPLMAHAPKPETPAVEKDPVAPQEVGASA
jgi:HK97 family phage portal protein